MKKTLIITAHPSSKGFTHKIAQSYSKGVLEKGGEVKLIDLYKEENKQDYFAFEDIEDIPTDPKRKMMQALIVWAEELVIIFPLWWLYTPAVLKNFFDTNFSVGFAYKYEYFPILKGRPKGLLKGRTARVFVTCDGPKIVYKLVLTPFKISLKYFTLRLAGFKVDKFIIFDRMKWRSEKKRQKWLLNVEKIAKKN